MLKGATVHGNLVQGPRVCHTWDAPEIQVFGTTQTHPIQTQQPKMPSLTTSHYLKPRSSIRIWGNISFPWTPVLPSFLANGL
jgi:hypothetical protein